MKEISQSLNWVSLWKRCYQRIYGDAKQYTKRLTELETWNKPLCPPSKDKAGKWEEWEGKKEALKQLIKGVK